MAEEDPVMFVEDPASRHQELSAWLDETAGPDYDPEEFDIEYANFRPAHLGS